MRYCAGSCGLLITVGASSAAAAVAATAAAGNANNAEAARAAMAARREGCGDAGDGDGDGACVGDGDAGDGGGDGDTRAADSGGGGGVGDGDAGDRDLSDGDAGDGGGDTRAADSGAGGGVGDGDVGAGAADSSRVDSLLNLSTLTSHLRVKHMKLHGSYTSPFVRHCRVALAQEGIAFDFVEVDHAVSAAQSPVAKMPYLTDFAGDDMLTDSSSIVKYARESGGGRFLAELADFETFALANTVADSMINVFLLETEGFDADKIRYIGRQQKRIGGGLNALNERVAGAGIRQDGALRCACMLDWALFRGRIDGLDAYPNLRALLDAANAQAVFADTAPPPAPPPSAQ